jgi:hypothetical protein
MSPDFHEDSLSENIPGGSEPVLQFRGSMAIEPRNCRTGNGNRNAAQTSETPH